MTGFPGGHGSHALCHFRKILLGNFRQFSELFPWTAPNDSSAPNQQPRLVT